MRKQKKTETYPYTIVADVGDASAENKKGIEFDAAAARIGGFD